MRLLVSPIDLHTILLEEAAPRTTRSPASRTCRTIEFAHSDKQAALIYMDGAQQSGNADLYLKLPQEVIAGKRRIAYQGWLAPLLPRTSRRPQCIRQLPLDELRCFSP